MHTKSKKWPTRRDFQQIDASIRDVFPDTKSQDLDLVHIWSSILPTGQKITTSIYADKPWKVQISFHIDRELRKLYGPVSPKDVASNKYLMPGTLNLMRKLRALVRNLRESKYQILYNPIDKRRARFYEKLLDSK